MAETELAGETYRLLRQVPAGRVTTYGALARALGAAEAARLVGEFMAQNPYAPEVPCHRVVHSDGRLGKYSAPGGPDRKARLLREEGVQTGGGRVLDFEKVLFEDFRGERPLEKLREHQLSLLPRLRLTDEREPYSSLVAVDVAYTPLGAFAAGALHRVRDIGPGSAVSVRVKVDFPYIPTFLGFREIPAIKAVLDILPDRPDLLLIDGNGTLHPHGMGIASQAGIELDIPTVGVAKSLLCGEVKRPPLRAGDASEVLVGGEVRGHALRVSAAARGVVFVSPGHLVSPRRAVELVRMVVAGGKVAPLSRAHLAAREAAATFKSGRPVADSG